MQLEIQESLIISIDEAFPGGEPVVIELHFDPEERLRYRVMRLEDIQNPDISPAHSNGNMQENDSPA